MSSHCADLYFYKSFLQNFITEKVYDLAEVKSENKGLSTGNRKKRQRQIKFRLVA